MAVLQQEHDAFKGDLPQHQEAFDALTTLQTGMVELGASTNPYSPHVYTVSRGAW